MVFRRNTFTELGQSYFSLCTYGFKINNIVTLLNRAYKITSNYNNLHQEFAFLKNDFNKNGFPLTTIETKIQKFLDNKCTNDSPPTTVTNQEFYFLLPYFRRLAEKKLVFLFQNYLTNIS